MGIATGDQEDVEAYWFDCAKRRAFNDGYDAQQNCAANPYVDPVMRAEWERGNKWKPE